jgi:hypothetical protein
MLQVEGWEEAHLGGRGKVYTAFIEVLAPSGYGMDRGLPILCEITI